MRKLCLSLAIVSIIACNKKNDNPSPAPNPTPSPQQPVDTTKCSPKFIDFKSDLSNYDKTQWRNDFTYDGQNRLTKIVGDNKEYDVTHSGNQIDYVTCKDGPRVFTIRYFYTGQNVTRTVTKYVTADSVIYDYKYNADNKLTHIDIVWSNGEKMKRILLYDNSGNVIKMQMFGNTNSLTKEYNYTYSAHRNRINKEVLNSYYIDTDDEWENAVYDFLMYSNNVPSKIDYYFIRDNVRETYNIAVDTNTNGYITQVRSNGNIVVNLDYNCK